MDWGVYSSTSCLTIQHSHAGCLLYPSSLLNSVLTGAETFRQWGQAQAQAQDNGTWRKEIVLGVKHLQRRMILCLKLGASRL